jgi:hypothetical protein
MPFTRLQKTPSQNSRANPCIHAVATIEGKQAYSCNPHKVGEEVSNKETRNQFEPRDVRVSLPRRADERSEVRSSGDNVPTSASLDVEVD